ncbi:MAG: dihydrolipoyl dehydrogenase, partial [SAR324 cluster bacterium]|nr:dihydrolipoyl dehydrogenase [SAR324 cluster bacterium]
MEKYDVIVIGGGPGGYVAAVRARQLGLKTALVEKEHLGGTCLNWGCIPTKSLLRNAEVIHLLSKGKSFGFDFDNLVVDYAVAHKRSRSIVSRQTKRVAFLMKNSGVDVYDGTGSLSGQNQVQIEPSGEVLQGKNIILATGAKPRPIPGVSYDGERIITYKEALNLTQIPQSAVIIGAGPIGMEFATIWNRYGANVSVVEMQPHVLPFEDEDISLEAERQFKRNRIQLHCDTQVTGISKTTDSVDIAIRNNGEDKNLNADLVLVSIGIIPNIEGLGLAEAGVGTEKGHVVVDKRMQSSQPNIYAIGDITGKMPLAHVASAQAMIAVDAIAGRPTKEICYPDIPRCTYSQPEVASVGLTEKQAREKGYEVLTAQCPFIANGKAIAVDDNSG